MLYLTRISFEYVSRDIGITHLIFRQSPKRSALRTRRSCHACLTVVNQLNLGMILGAEAKAFIGINYDLKMNWTMPDAAAMTPFISLSFKY